MMNQIDKSCTNLDNIKCSVISEIYRIKRKIYFFLIQNYIILDLLKNLSIFDRKKNKKLIGNYKVKTYT